MDKPATYSLYANQVTMNVSNYNSKAYQSPSSRFYQSSNTKRSNIEDGISRIDEKINRIQNSCHKLQSSLYSNTKESTNKQVFQYGFKDKNNNTQVVTAKVSPNLFTKELINRDAETDNFNRKLISDLNQRVDELSDENLLKDNKIESLTFRLQEMQKETINHISANSSFQKRFNDYDSIKKENQSLKEQLEECHNEINHNLKPIIYKYESQFEITQIEVRAMEND